MRRHRRTRDLQDMSIRDVRNSRRKVLLTVSLFVVAERLRCRAASRALMAFDRTSESSFSFVWSSSNRCSIVWTSFVLSRGQCDRSCVRDLPQYGQVGTLGTFCTTGVLSLLTTSIVDTCGVRYFSIMDSEILARASLG
jgi:hypothetical protein